LTSNTKEPRAPVISNLVPTCPVLLGAATYLSGQEAADKQGYSFFLPEQSFYVPTHHMLLCKTASFKYTLHKCVGVRNCLHAWACWVLAALLSETEPVAENLMTVVQDENCVGIQTSLHVQ